MFSCFSGVLEPLEERSCQWDVPGPRRLDFPQHDSPHEPSSLILFSFQDTAKGTIFLFVFFYHEHNVTFNLEVTAFSLIAIQLLNADY